MEYISGNVFVRPMVFQKAGESRQGHEHNFGHTLYVPRGSALIEQVRLHKETGDVLEVLKSVTKKASDGFNWVFIAAEICHRVTALEDNTICHCIFAHRNPQGDVVQAYDGWTPGYV